MKQSKCNLPPWFIDVCLSVDKIERQGYAAVSCAIRTMLLKMSNEEIKKTKKDCDTVMKWRKKK